MLLFWKSFAYAGSGIWFCLRHERNFRIHLVITIYVLCFAPAFSLSRAEWAILFLTMALVLAAEAINTAIENAVNLSSPKIHPTARIAKDVAAAAVLICSVASICVGVVLFGRPEELSVLFNGLFAQPWKTALLLLSLFVSILFILRGGSRKIISDK